MTLAVTALAGAGLVHAQPPIRRADSPAATPVPATRVEQSYAPALVEAGREIFSAQCGFCHGRDAAGGTGGPDLTRSELVADDVRGDLIGAAIRAGRPNAEIPMPAFAAMEADDVDAIVAFIHDQKSLAESNEGGRRAVTPEDLATGNARAGQRFFESNCTGCHSAGRDLAGIASRSEGLDLLRRMLYPGRGGRGGPSPRAQISVTVTTADGTRFRGPLVYADEFTIALTDEDDRYRSFATRSVAFEIDDPLAGHIDLLGQYSDEEMHDVLAFLNTLR